MSTEVLQSVGGQPMTSGKKGNTAAWYGGKMRDVMQGMTGLCPGSKYRKSTFG